MPRRTICIPYDGGWRRRRDLRLWRCNRVAVEQQFNTDRSGANAERHALILCISKKGSPYSITERKVPELIPVLGGQPAGDVSHKPDGRLPLLSARPAVTPETVKRTVTNFAAW